MGLTIQQIANRLDAEVLAGSRALDREVTHAQGSDLMSDVLAFSHPGALLVTGLINPQVIRTADVAGMLGVVFVRGKRPHQTVIQMAEDSGLPLLVTRLGMFDTCGTLYQGGLRGMNHLMRLRENVPPGQ